MKNGKKIFILVETFLGLMVFVLVMFMFLEKNEKKQEKISVIIQNSDDSQWAAFKYGAKMAAADKKTEVFVVSTAGSLSVQEEENLIEREIANGASGIIVEPANGEKTEKMLKEVEKKVPVVLVESLASSDGTETKMPVTGADNYAMGKALAEELLKDCGGNIKGKKIGLVSGEENAEAISERAEGVRAVLEEKQADETGRTQEDLEANAFAGLLLMPDQLLHEQILLYGLDKDLVTVDSVLMLMDMFAMPYKAVVLRLFESGNISHQQAEKLLEVGSADVMERVSLTGKAKRWQLDGKGTESFGTLLEKVEYNRQHEYLTESREKEDVAYLTQLKKEYGLD